MDFVDVFLAMHPFCHELEPLKFAHRLKLHLPQFVIGERDLVQPLVLLSRKAHVEVLVVLVLLHVPLQVQLPVDCLALDRCSILEERGNSGPLYVGRLVLGRLDELGQQHPVVVRPAVVDLLFVRHWNGYTIRCARFYIYSPFKNFKDNHNSY